MYLHLLYIDPGMGSLLFSVIIGLAATAFFAFRTLFINLKYFLTGGKSIPGVKNKFVIYAEDKRYWTLFKPIVEEFESRGIELLYLTSSQDDPVFINDYKHIKTEYLGEGNKVFTRLNFLSADFVLATTPGLDVYQWKRSKMVKHYSHILHTPSEAIFYELFGIDYYDSILTTGGDFQLHDIQKLEKKRNLPNKQIVTVGCPYLDEYVKLIEQIPLEENKPFTILVSPSWGIASLLSRFGEKLLDPLVKTGWRIIIRPHPQSLIVEKDLIDSLYEKYKENPNFLWDFEQNNIHSLKKADIMISDFSGIILDYMFLQNKPVIYLSGKLDIRSRDIYQIYKNQEDMWTFRSLHKTAIELKPELLNELPDIISNISTDTSMKTAIEEIKAEAWHYQGKAGKRVADFMVEKIEECLL